MSRSVSRGFRRDLFTGAVEASGMQRPDLARLADMSVATIRQWERRGGSPDIERLSRICKVLNIGVDELVLVPDEECMPSDLRNRRGMTQMQLGVAAGLSTTVVSGFERAETRWSEAKAAKIALVLQVSVEQLRQAWQRARERPAGAPA